jgi:hypothetical protein
MTFNNSKVASCSLLAVATLLLVFASACGGGSSSSSNNSSSGGTGSTGGSTTALSNTCATSTGNCATLTTNNGLGYVNGSFTSVTVCQPGSATQCATVNGVLVDTGSVGLKLFKSQITSAQLTTATYADNHAVVECYPFVATYMWGTVAPADIKIAGETATSAPIMVIDDSPSPAFDVPGTCSDYQGGPLTAVNSASDFGANGILGIGSTPQDCGAYCALPASSQVDSSNEFNGLYYDCSSPASCIGASLAVTAQVPHPVSKFTTDNNGTAIVLASVVSGGAASATGALYFGIGTQSNNTMPSSANVFLLDTTYEQFITTSYKGTTNSESYVDSGSNGLFFDDLTIAICTNTQFDGQGSDWYCPGSALSLSATNSGGAGSSGSTANNTVSFSVANANTLFSANNGNDTAFDNLGGSGSTGTFDWGLPFFYGRAVYNAIEGNSVTNTGGTAFAGPFVAY